MNSLKTNVIACGTMKQQNNNIIVILNVEMFPVGTGRKLNIRKTLRRRPRRLLNVLCTFNLRPVSAGFLLVLSEAVIFDL